MIRHVYHLSIRLVLGGLLLAAVLLSALRFALPRVEHYRADLEAIVSQLLERPVTIQRLRASLHGFSPALVLGDLRVETPDGSPSLQLKEIHVSVDVLDMLLTQRWFDALTVTLIGVKLTIVRGRDGALRIAGLRGGGDDQPYWLLRGARYRILESQLDWHDESDGSTLQLDRVDIDLRNRFVLHHHRVNVTFWLPQSRGEHVHLAFDLRGNPFEPAGISGQLYVEAEHVDLALLDNYLPTGYQLAGRGDVRLWGVLQQARLISLIGDSHLRAARVSMPQRAPLTVAALHTAWRWQASPSAWQLDVAEFAWQNDLQRPAQHAAFSVRVTGSAEQPMTHVAAYVGRLDLALAAQLARWSAALPKDTTDWLRRLAPQGQLQQLTAFWSAAPRQLAFHGRFSEFGMRAMGAVPGLQGVTGHIAGNLEQGRLVLATRQAQLDAKTLFRQPLDLQTLDGVIVWQKEDTAWRVTIPGFHVTTPDLALASRAELRIPTLGDAKTFLDFHATFQLTREPSHIKKYLPTTIMGQDTVVWLDRAFSSGHITDGAVSFFGHLEDYPFAHHDGVFQARFRTHDLTLMFDPAWPVIENLDAEAWFEGESFTLTATRGRLGATRIDSAKVRIPSFEHSEHVLVQGKVQGTLPHVLDVLRQSPLRDTILAADRHVQAAGATTLDLDLQIPIVTGAPTVVQGAAKLDDARLKVLALDLPIERLRGVLRFDETGLFAEALRGTALGFPLHARLINEPQQMVIGIDSRVTVAALAQLFPGYGWRLADGETDYRLNLTIPKRKQEATLLHISSDLSGIALELPGSLAKTHDARRHLELRFTFLPDAPWQLEGHYAGQLKTRLVIDDTEGLQRGAVAWGEALRLPPLHAEERGLQVAIEPPRLDKETLAGLLALSSGAGDQATGLLRRLHIQTPHFWWGRQDHGAMTLHLQREGDFWRGGLVSALARGSLQLPTRWTRQALLDIALDRLDITSLATLGGGSDRQTEDETALSLFDPQELPGLKFSSRKLLWYGRDLGALTMIVKPVRNGLNCDSLELHAPGWVLRASGNWRGSGQTFATALGGSLTSEDFGALLERLDLTSAVKKTPATIKFEWQWDGGPQDFQLQKLTGWLDLFGGEGRLLSVEPGLGRVLGALDLEQWYRRLRLDFSDIYAEGLAYNGIEGRWSFNGKGAAHTDFFVMDALPARIALHGRIDLAARALDQVIIVTPKSSVTLPIAGTIAGGPAVGAAMLLAQQLFSEQLDGFTRSGYRLHGSWREPQVVPIPEKDGLLRRVWSQMTRFPWSSEPSSSSPPQAAPDKSE